MGRCTATCTQLNTITAAYPPTVIKHDTDCDLVYVTVLSFLFAFSLLHVKNEECQETLMYAFTTDTAVLYCTQYFARTRLSPLGRVPRYTDTCIPHRELMHVGLRFDSLAFSCGTMRSSCRGGTFTFKIPTSTIITFVSKTVQSSLPVSSHQRPMSYSKISNRVVREPVKA